MEATEDAAADRDAGPAKVTPQLPSGDLPAILFGMVAVLFAVQIAFQLRRIHNEELVGTAASPEYAAY